MKYTKEKLFDVAKRHNNRKRNYLLINKKQAKYVPTKPSEVFAMADDLVNMAITKGVSLEVPTLVIGFAETATALGEIFAKHFSQAFYLTTTREDVSAEDYLEFKEEHSYVVEQRLVISNLRKEISCFNQVIFVDDEFTTGKTLRNLAETLTEEFPILERCSLFAVTPVNRINRENTELLVDLGFTLCELLKIENDNFEIEMEDVEVISPKQIKELSVAGTQSVITLYNYNFRIGYWCDQFGGHDIIQDLVNDIIDNHCAQLDKEKSLLVLGTEEFMCIPLHVARELEEQGFNVMCQATARTPVGINRTLAQYPIKNGIELPSLYGGRSCYLYNLGAYDQILVVTDAPFSGTPNLMYNDITAVLISGGDILD